MELYHIANKKGFIFVENLKHSISEKQMKLDGYVLYVSVTFSYFLSLRFTLQSGQCQNWESLHRQKFRKHILSDKTAACSFTKWIFNQFLTNRPFLSIKYDFIQTRELFSNIHEYIWAILYISRTQFFQWAFSIQKRTPFIYLWEQFSMINEHRFPFENFRASLFLSDSYDSISCTRDEVISEKLL